MPSYEFKYDVKNQCVIGKMVGDARVNTIMEYAGKLIEFGAQHKCDRFLSDFREAEVGFVTTLDTYEFPETLDSQGLKRTMKRAIVTNEITDSYRFYETVLTNRGYNTKVFTDYDKALEWLKK